MSFVRKEWATKSALLAEVADVPDNWLRGFVITHPLDCRKFADSRSGKMLYRVSAVLAAIESGEAMPNDGIVRREAPGADPGEGGIGAAPVMTVAVPVRDPKEVS